MSTPLRVLILEDNPNDYELALYQLRRAGYEPQATRVETEAEFSARLDPALDLILADYALPQFDGLRALEIVRARAMDVPFILVSGAIGEDLAVEAMKKGASDYVMKDRLVRLDVAVTRALEERNLRAEKQRAQAALNAAAQYARSIIDSSLDMIITTDKERRIVEFNRAAQETFGYTRDEMLGQHISILYAAPEEGHILHQTVFDHGRVVQEIANKRKNGETFPTFLSAAVMRDAKGQVVGMVGVSRDITERKQAEAKLRYLSMHDALTGLYNRVYFEEEKDRLEKGRQFPMSVIMADLDGLKKINDLQGHAAGDELLRQAASVLKATFRTDDILARIGGDEFAALLPSTDTDATDQILERLRNNLAIHNTEPERHFLSLSIGAAAAQKDSSLSEVLRQADLRMYQEKARFHSSTAKR